MSKKEKYITAIVIAKQGGSILKRLTLSAIVGLWSIVMMSGVVSAGALSAGAELLSIGGSGVQAEITFVDTGTALLVTGEAEGLDPAGVYVSLIYDLGSVATGPTACEPTSNALTFEQMFMGFWLPMGSSERTLQMFNGKVVDFSTLTFSFTPTPAGGKTGEFFTPVGTFATVSVRQADAGFVVRACGVVLTED